MWQRIYSSAKNFNLFADENDQETVITNQEDADNKRKLQLYATRLYIILFIGETSY